MSWSHIPVMCDEVVEALAPADGDILVDATLGLGGHSEALLRAADCRIVGIDRDRRALEIAGQRLAKFGDRISYVHARFSELDVVLESIDVGQVHGVLADLGVSSMQLDDPARGFSFRANGPVDMRMNSHDEFSAGDAVNTWDEARLARCIYENGEEGYSRRIAHRIVAGRPWSDTVTLAETIARAIGGKRGRIHPATRTFQALRIAVNDELGELKRFLPIAVDHLLPDGRLAILTFHSLEDRIVKRFLSRESGRNADRDLYGNPLGTFRVSAPRRSRTPSPHDSNPRARSARLRTAVRL